MPITIPSGIEVKIEGSRITVKGPKGELSRDLIPDMKLSLSDGVLTVARPSDQPRHRAAHGLTRTLVQNMVTGVSEGFAKTLELQGVGYRAQMQGTNLVLAVGYSKPVEVPPPPGIEFEVEGTSAGHREGDQQGGRGPDGGGRPQGEAAGALQGQRDPLSGRVRTPQGRQGRQGGALA